jgi:hypothetical protein
LTLHYQNLGFAAAQGVTLVDTLPPGLDFVAAAGTYDPAGRTVTFLVGPLAADDAAPGGPDEGSVTLTAQVAATSGSLTNQAAISTSTPEADLSNNTSTVTLDVTPRMLRVTPAALTATAGGPTSPLTVATFVDSGGPDATDTYQATIDWQDGTPATAGTLTFDGTAFVVTASHTYAQAGTFPVAVTITHTGATPARADAMAQVSASPAGAPGLPPGGGGATTAPTVTGGTPVVTPAGDGPIVLKVLRFGIHRQRTRLVVIFDEALDPTSAEDPSNYRIVADQAARRGAAIAIESAQYDPEARAVILSPRRRLNVHHRFKLLIRGTGPGAIEDLAGRALDGTVSGHAGTNQTKVIGPWNLVLAGHDHVISPSSPLRRLLRLADGPPQGPRASGLPGERPRPDLTSNRAPIPVRPRLPESFGRAHRGHTPGA